MLRPEVPALSERRAVLFRAVPSKGVPRPQTDTMTHVTSCNASTLAGGLKVGRVVRPNTGSRPAAISGDVGTNNR